VRACYPLRVSNAPRLATYADLLACPDDARVELFAGAVVSTPAPLPRHSNPQRSLGRFVGGPFHDDDGHGGPGGWWIFLEVDVRFGPHDVLRPDLAGWRRERLVLPDVRPIDVVPDWVCEILSPSTASRDRVYKRRLNARHGVGSYWVVDPEARTLEAFTLKDGTWVDAGAFDDEAIARVAPFEAVELPIRRLFLPRDAKNEGA
jgi:Uma2 family endonuclease